MDVRERERIAKLYGVAIDVWRSFPIAAFSCGTPMKSLGVLAKEHQTLLCSVNDYRDVCFGHAVVIHAGDLYDPHAGINPAWPWSRVITHASPVDLAATKTPETSKVQPA
jgi:hypothetical protein